MHRPRVVIVSDDPLTRSGLAALLGGTGDVIVAGVSGTGPDEPELAGVDVVLLDPGGATDSLRRMGAAVPVVALVADDAQAADALGAGARGAVFRNASAEQLTAALAAAHRGLLAVDGALAPWLHLPSPRAQAEAEGALTKREGQVLALLAQGLSNKAIAQRLGIGDRTAKFHVESILGKLGAASRSEAIIIAARRGLISF